MTRAWVRCLLVLMRLPMGACGIAGRLMTHVEYGHAVTTIVYIFFELPILCSNIGGTCSYSLKTEQPQFIPCNKCITPELGLGLQDSDSKMQLS